MTLRERILKLPWAYTGFQRLVGATELRRRCIRRADIQPDERVLDVGCGPAYYLDWLPPVDYHGFDTDPDYIAAAAERFGDRGTFACEVYSASHIERLGAFDIALGLGVLHHMDDRQCNELLDLLRRSLGSGGRVITLDTCFYEGQARVARWMAELDRGEHVRSAEAFINLASNHFPKVSHELIGDNSVLPQSYVMMELHT